MKTLAAASAGEHSVEAPGLRILAIVGGRRTHGGAEYGTARGPAPRKRVVKAVVLRTKAAMRIWAWW